MVFPRNYLQNISRNLLFDVKEFELINCYTKDMGYFDNTQPTVLLGPKQFYKPLFSRQS